MDEPFQRGELVTLRDVDPPPLGRIVTVDPAGDRAEVVWHKRAGQEHQAWRGIERNALKKGLVEAH